MTIQEIKKELFENTAEHVIVRFTDSKGRRYAFIKAWTLFKVDSWELFNLERPSSFENARERKTKYYIEQDKFIAAIKRILKK
jgi:hypothetical protein